MRNKLILVTFSLVMTVLLSGCSKEPSVPSEQARPDKAWTIEGFSKADSINPILTADPNSVFYCPVSGSQVNWESRNVLNPAALVKDGMVYLFYRAQDPSGTSRIGLATSTDGLHFNSGDSPVLFPDNDAMNPYEWNYRKISGEKVDPDCTNCYFDGVEDPRIIMGEKGNYVMTYTAYDGRTARLCVATSKDLRQWTKQGLAFKDPKYKDLWSKAGAIVTEQREGQFVAKKIDGRYWMYFGDTDIFLASSADLLTWEICENMESGQKISVMHPRMGYFDSRLVEPGPFAMYRDGHILLIYNASNAMNFNDKGLPKFTYAAGQALFEGQNPYKLIDRSDTYFIHPDKDYERVGEVNEVCFVEGLVDFEGKWLLYYGTADSMVAVAAADQ